VVGNTRVVLYASDFFTKDLNFIEGVEIPRVSFPWSASRSPLKRKGSSDYTLLKLYIVRKI
jgi:hypothetical protein